MARPAETIEDATPLNGTHVDVARRLGWLLRVSRLRSGITQSAMAQRLRAAGFAVTASKLSHLETGVVRNGRLVDGYEQVLGLEPGRMRAAGDVLCRSFAHPPPDQDPRAPWATDLAGFDEAVAPVLAGAGTASDWYRFARAHDPDTGFGLPSAGMRAAVDRLISELSRSVGPGYVVRYEALTLLRCGPYGDVVEDAVRRWVEEPSTQVVNDVMSAVAERTSGRVFTWAASLLRHDSTLVARGAALAIQNMRSVGGLPPSVWPAVVDDFCAAYERGDTGRRDDLTELYRNLPPAVRRTIAPRLTAALQPSPAPDDWTASRRNRHFAVVDDLAAQACAALGLPPQPMLSRLLFEILFDFRQSRVVTSSLLLKAAPLDGVLVPLLSRLAERRDDEATRLGAAGAVVAVQTPADPTGPTPWLTDPDPVLVECGLVVHAHGGTHVPPARLTALVADPRTRWRALYAAGMTGHPLLGSLAARRDHEVGPAARWWLRQGPRVVG